MKLWILLFVAILVKDCSASDLSKVGSLSELVTELEKQRLASKAEKGRVNSSQRSGRILASYVLETVRGTEKASQKLDNMKQAVDELVTELARLNSVVSTEDSAVTDKLKGINDNLGSGSLIVNTLNTIGNGLNGIVHSLTDRSSNSTVGGQLKSFYDIINDSMISLEKALGYDTTSHNTTNQTSKPKTSATLA